MFKWSKTLVYTSGNCFCAYLGMDDADAYKWKNNTLETKYACPNDVFIDVFFRYEGAQKLRNPKEVKIYNVLIILYGLDFSGYSDPSPQCCQWSFFCIFSWIMKF